MSQSLWMELITNVVTSVIAIGFMTNYIGAGYTGLKHYLFFTGGTAAYFITVTVMNVWVHFEGVLGLAYSILLVVYARIALKGNLWDEIIASWIWVFIALFSSYAVFAILRIITGYDFHYLITIKSSTRFLVLTVTTMIKIVMSCLMIRFLKQRKLYLEKKDGWTMIVAYTAVFSIVTGFFAIELYEGYSKPNSYMTVILVIVLIGVVIWLSYFYWKLSDFNQERMKLDFLKSYMENQKGHVEEIGKTYEELRILRHDIRGHLTNLYLLIKSGESEKAMRYIESKDQQINNYPVITQLTENQGLNAALYRAVTLCKMESIDFSYFIEGNITLIDEADMGILFYNLLNNAVEACMKVEGGRKICLKIKVQGCYFKCKLYNSIAGSVLKENPEMKSDKKDSGHHGYGMKSIRCIVEKYNGIYKNSEENDVFIQQILLMIK